MKIIGSACYHTLSLDSVKMLARMKQLYKEKVIIKAHIHRCETK